MTDPVTPEPATDVWTVRGVVAVLGLIAIVGLVGLIVRRICQEAQP